MLTAEQARAREEFVRVWHEVMPARLGFIERFNQGFVARLPARAGARTLEVGPGLGAQARWRGAALESYVCLEERASFCETLRGFLPREAVFQGDIQERQRWPDGDFERIIAIHILEHLKDLPAALAEIDRLLAPDGCFDVVVPTEGGLAYALGRKLSAERLFRKRFRMDYTPIRQNEHVSTYTEIAAELTRVFRVERRVFYPLAVPIATLNLFVGYRLRRKFPGGLFQPAASSRGLSKPPPRPE
ncbi:MAG: class I SAM-dependent methyltransferase [Deltaproteobacteria bacterium]|nr:class I SAM-dependent methyltransferase [Deltaproteobacteria bacterium]